METEQADRDLVLRLRRGDSSGLDVVLERYWAPLVSYVIGFGVDRDTAEDVAQQVFIRIWERRESLKLEGSLRGFLFRIARNLYFDVCRRRKARERARRNGADSVQSKSPHDQVVSGELQTIIERAINALPERRRDVFVLVRCHGFSHREVAETLDLAPQTVANHLGMALADLRVSLAPYFPDYLRHSVTAEKRLQSPRTAGALGV